MNRVAEQALELGLEIYDRDISPMESKEQPKLNEILRTIYAIGFQHGYVEGALMMGKVSVKREDG